MEPGVLSLPAHASSTWASCAAVAASHGSPNSIFLTRHKEVVPAAPRTSGAQSLFFLTITLQKSSRYSLHRPGDSPSRAPQSDEGPRLSSDRTLQGHNAKKRGRWASGIRAQGHVLDHQVSLPHKQSRSGEARQAWVLWDLLPEPWTPEAWTNL